jgi:hypothetical protein
MTEDLKQYAGEDVDVLLGPDVTPELVIRLGSSEIDATSLATFIGFIDDASAEGRWEGPGSVELPFGRFTRVYVQSGSVEVVVQAFTGNADTLALLLALRYILQHFPVWAETLSRSYVDIQVGKAISIRNSQLKELLAESKKEDNIPHVVEEAIKSALERTAKQPERDAAVGDFIKSYVKDILLRERRH